MGLGGMSLSSSGTATIAMTTQPTMSAMLMSIVASQVCADAKGDGRTCPPGGYHRPVSHDPHFDLPASAWVQRWLAWIRPGGAVLDVAAGSGRHARLLARMGFEVDAVDRDASLFADPPPNVAVLQ